MSDKLNTSQDFDAVWKEYYDQLLSFIRKRISDKCAAEDILQDVFLKILNKINSLEDRSKIKSWIYQIARNSVIDYYRSIKQQNKMPEFLITGDSKVENNEMKEFAKCLIPMINKLPDKYKQALLFTEINNMSQKELAEKTNLSYAGAKSRVQRARALLKKELTDCCQFEIDKYGTILNYKSKSCNQNNC